MRQANRKRMDGSLGGHHAKARLLSNKTHYSLSDPGARISVKPGKARALNYLCSLAVDTATGLVSHIQADLADRRDSVHLPGLIQQLQARLTGQELPLRAVLADAGYSNGFNYAFLERRAITPWIPVFGCYKPVIEGFAYEAAGNAYRCPAGKLLPFRKYSTRLDGNWLKNYRAEYRDCQSCALKPTCVPLGWYS
ncbi:MAG: transposase [Janthinobacterium lividum]